MNIIYIILGILSATSVTVIILLCIYIVKLNKLTKMYNKALAKFNSKENIQDEIQSIYDRLNGVELICKNNVDTVNNFTEKMKKNIQKVGFVKYNAYDDTENKLSFAVSLLDDNNDGILINHIHSKHGSNVYAKYVVSGKVEDRISEEEAEALNIATNDKEFKVRKTTEITKTRKIGVNRK